MKPKILILTTAFLMQGGCNDLNKTADRIQKSDSYQNNTYSYGKCAYSQSYKTVIPDLASRNRIPMPHIGDHFSNEHRVIQTDQGRVEVDLYDYNRDDKIDSMVISSKSAKIDDVYDSIGVELRIHSVEDKKECPDTLSYITSDRTKPINHARADFCQSSVNCSMEIGDTCSNIDLPRYFSVFGVVYDHGYNIRVSDYSVRKISKRVINGPSCSPFNR